MTVKYVWAVALSACVFSGNVLADEASGPYLGASIGTVTDEVDGFQDSGLGFKIFGGYALNRYFAAELAYVDAGKLEDRVDGLDVTVESSGIVAALFGRLPVSDSFSLFAKVGYALYDEKVSVHRGNLSNSEKNNADDPVYGIGAAIALGKRIELRAEYELVDVPQADFELVTIGVALQF